jgi:hypothetical protein
MVEREKLKRAIAFFLLGVLVGALAFYGYLQLGNRREEWASGKERGFQYLVNSYNPAIGLCHEFVGSGVYWICHDNILASHVLEQWNRTVADNITETIKRLAVTYNLSVTREGLPLDCKMKALLGYPVDFSVVNNTINFTLSGSYYGSTINTEKDLENSSLNLVGYADMLCYASLVEWRRQNYSGADYYFENVTASWDGNGFKDDAYNATLGYETYKLGLYYFLSKTLSKDFAFKNQLIETVWSCQVGSGGFKTHYFSKGHPTSNSTTNTETASIILLAGIPASVNV